MLKGWKGGSEGVEISILRNQDSLYLDSRGGWVSGEMFLGLPTLNLIDEVPAVQVGPSFIDPLLANRQAAYRITIKNSATRDVGILAITDGLLSSQAGGENPLAENSQTLDVTPLAQPEPVVEAPAPAPVDDVPAAPASRKAPLAIILAVISLLLAAAAAGWWFMRTPAAADAPAPASAPVAAPVAKISGPCGDDQMSSGNAMEFVKGCLRSQPSSAQLLDVIAKAKAEKKCDVAQRLYAYKAQSGDSQMAMRYAQEYDPKSAQAEGCFSPDPQTASYWYEAVVNQDPQNAEAKARLAELKK
nr:hypothetical protein [Leclercia tamurae]